MYPGMMQGRARAVAPRQLPPYVFSTLQSPGRTWGASNDVGSMGGGTKRMGNSHIQQTSRSASVDEALGSIQGDSEGSECLATTSENVGDAKVTGDDKCNAVMQPTDLGERTSSPVHNTGSSGRPARARDRTPCAFFIKTGSCAYGDRCKFGHPFDKAPRVEYNSLGLPVRPDEPVCSFYMKNWQCAFGHTCKYNHPEPSHGSTGVGPAVHAVASRMHNSPSSTAEASLGMSSGSQHAMVYHSHLRLGSLAPYQLTPPYQVVPTLHPHLNSVLNYSYYPTQMANAGAYPVLVPNRQNQTRYQRHTDRNGPGRRRE